MLNSWRRHPQKGGRFARVWIVGFADDPSAVIDVIGIKQLRRPRWRKAVEVCHTPVFPNENVFRTGHRGTDQPLAAVINRVGKAAGITIDCFKILDATCSGPEESVNVRVCVFRESCDLTVIVDCRRRVPGVPTKALQVRNRDAFPEHRVGGAHVAESVFADSGNADHLTSVVEQNTAIVIGDFRPLLVDLHPAP
jgi:hypothetical protein